MKGNKGDVIKKKGMHDGHRKRMREAVEKDPDLESLSEYQALEYLLSFFIPMKDTNPVAHELIDTFGSFFGVCCASTQELFAVKNMTKMAACFLPNLFALVRKAEISKNRNNRVIETVEDGIEALHPYFSGRTREMFYLMTMDVNDRVINITLISTGVANLTSIDVDRIVSQITRDQACKVMLAHNHPGGNLMPSNDDIAATRTLAIVLNSMGRELADHVIFTHDGYFSFFEHDLLVKMFNISDSLLNRQRSREVSSRLFANQYVLEDKPENPGEKPVNAEDFKDKQQFNNDNPKTKKKLRYRAD